MTSQKIVRLVRHARRQPRVWKRSRFYIELALVWFNTETTRPKAYSDLDQELLETVANQLAMLIDNHRLRCQIAVLASRIKRERSKPIPICSYCKDVCNDRQEWEPFVEFLTDDFLLNFAHGICPSCYDGIVMRQIENFERKKRKREGS